MTEINIEINTESENEILVETSTIDNEQDMTLPPIPTENDEMIDLADQIKENFILDQQEFADKDEEDRLWKVRTGLDEDTLSGAIETIIFMTEKPASLVKIKNFIDEEMPLRVVFESIKRLQNEYEAKHHGLRLVEVAEGFQFRTKATFSKYVQDIFKVNSLVLTPASLESLAVIAYKQPVSRVELDKIRGVDSSHLIRGLMERRLVKIVGRSEDVGRPVLYGTTPEFLEVFSLNSLEDLPPERELEELSKKEVSQIRDIKTIVQTGDKNKFVFDESEELDKLSSDIGSIDSDTLFTKSLKIEDKKRYKNEGEIIRSAFDIMEEFVWTEEISRINETALNSQSMSSYIDPKVISDLTMGPFNIPEIEEDEDFQMIDLETGLVIENELSGDLGDELDIVVELEDNLPVDDESDLFMASYKEEEFEKLLDTNFENITGEKLPKWSELSTDEVDEILIKEEQITQKIDQINLDAEKLDINLTLE